jgi:predicted component of type VI protein secretion system
VELQFMAPSSWSAKIKTDFFDARITRYFLLVESTLQSSEVERLLRQRKISTAADLSQLIASNLHGLPIRRLADPPRGLPARTGRYTYFEITTDSPDWKAIRTRGDLVIFCPELAQQDVRVRLFREPTVD